MRESVLYDVRRFSSFRTDGVARSTLTARLRHTLAACSPSSLNRPAEYTPREWPRLPHLPDGGDALERPVFRGAHASNPGDSRWLRQPLEAVLRCGLRE